MNNDNERANLEEFKNQLKQIGFSSATPLSKYTLEKTAFYDFAFYEYLLPTEEQKRTPVQDYVDTSILSDYAAYYLYNLESGGVPVELLDGIAAMFTLLEQSVNRTSEGKFFNAGINSRDDFLRHFYEHSEVESFVRQTLRLERIGLLNSLIESLIYDALNQYLDSRSYGFSDIVAYSMTEFLEKIVEQAENLDSRADGIRL
jgi:hypothetical protein